MKFTVSAVSVALAAASNINVPGVSAFTFPSKGRSGDAAATLSFIGQRSSSSSSTTTSLRMGLLEQLFGTEKENDDDSTKTQKTKNDDTEPFFATSVADAVTSPPSTTKMDQKKKKRKVVPASSVQKPTESATTTASAAASTSTPSASETTTTSTTTVFEKPTEQEVRDLFSLWNDALATLDSDIVAQQYAKDAILHPTISDRPRDSYQLLKEYYDEFLLQKPQGNILQSFVTVGDSGTWCQDNGIYELTMRTTGDVVKARYTFFYVRDDESNGDWKIAHHHSSQMPEEIVSTTPLLEEKQVRDLFHLWNDALATKDPKVVTSRYAKSAVLLPTVSDLPRTDHENIERYFVDFVKLEPQGTVLESFVDAGQDWCRDSGIYEFAMKGGRKVKARYTFLYTLEEDGQWRIAHHHSSQMPEEIQPKGTAEQEAKANEGVKDVLSDTEIRALFDRWNDALASKDPRKVAALYSKKSAILLPTVSDSPRTDEAGITDYYDMFLQKQPQGTIVDGVTLAGQGWCKDAGAYEFVMGATGDKVLARYSFVYVLEDGEWKIAHHHSSMMPEPILKAKEEQESKAKESTLPEKDVRKMFDKWNRALASGDARKVAALYHPDALLLPTVSNVPRMTTEAIQDYFTTFLKDEPRCVINEAQSAIMSGKNYAEDAGVCEYTMKGTGETITERYSFIYTKDETSGEWKIAHHHSSALPEALLEAGKKYELIEKTLFADNTDA